MLHSEPLKMHTLCNIHAKIAMHFSSAVFVLKVNEVACNSLTNFKVIRLKVKIGRSYNDQGSSVPVTNGWTLSLQTVWKYCPRLNATYRELVQLKGQRS